MASVPTESAVAVATTSTTKQSPAPSSSSSSSSPQPVSLTLSQDTSDRLCSAAALLRVSPDILIRRLLSDFYNALGGLPTDLMLYIFTFLDYSTLASVVCGVSKRWSTVLQRDPAQHASALRQMHGVHLLDPVRGIFYYPRALKRVQLSAERIGAGAAGGNKPGGGGGAGTADPRGGAGPASFSFLTVDIRTQDIRSLPWASVKHIVRQATEDEKMMYGMVRTPSLQKPESPVLMQAAMVTHDRLIYTFGGQTYEGIVVNRCFCYNPQTKRWRPLPPLREKRASATAAVLMGKVYVFGGYGEEEQVLNSYEVFDLQSGVWERPPALGFLSRNSTTAAATTPTLFDGDGQSSSSFSGAPCTSRLASDDAAARTATATKAKPQDSATPRRDDAAVDPGPFRMPEKLCGAAVVAYKDVFLFVGGFREYIAPTDTAVHYSGMSSLTTTPLHPNHPRMVPSMSTSSMDAAAAAAVAEVGTEGIPHLRGAPLRTTGAATASQPGGVAPSSTAANMARSSAFLTAATPPPQPESEEAGVAVLPPSTTSPHDDSNDANAGVEGDGSAGPLRPLLPLPRLPSISLDGPSAAEKTVWVFSPSLQRWWLQGPALPTPRAFGSAAVLVFPGALGTCLCYFGGCTSADEPEMSMLYIPLNDQDDDQDERAAGAQEGVAATEAPDTASGELGDTSSYASYSPFHASASASLSRRIPRNSEVMHRYFRDPLRLTWHRYLRIPLGGAFTSVAVIGKESSRSVVLSAFYPTPNIGFCHVSKLLPADTCTRAEWRSTDSTVHRPEHHHDDEREEAQQEHEQEEDENEEDAAALRRQSTADASISQAGLSLFSPPLAEAADAGAAGAADEAQPHPTSDEGQSARAAMHLSPALLRARGQGAGNTVSVNTASFSTVATPVRRDQRRDVQQLLRTAVDAASQHRPRNPQTVGEDHQWHLAPLSEVRVRDDVTGRPLMNRVSWRIQALNAKPIVPIE